LQAIPLALTPSAVFFLYRGLIFVAIIIATLSPDVREPTPLESYLCRSLAFTLVAFGVLVVVLTGSVPLTVRFVEGEF
jgi:ribose/xylose/arabinose/galactoside ABC-type transport system permease subunit